MTNIEDDMTKKREEKAKRCIKYYYVYDFHFFVDREKELAKVVVKKEDIELIVSCIDSVMKISGCISLSLSLSLS